MSWETTDVLSADTTDVLSANTRDGLSADTTDVLSAVTSNSGKPTPGFARFGTLKMEISHHLDTKGDLPAKIAGVALTR